MPEPRRQIRHLQSLLAELGMKGNPTLGKAKAIKERRELATELDDVKDFEAVRGLRADESRRSSRAGKSKSFAESDENAGDDPTQSALGAVLDFLGSDSD